MAKTVTLDPHLVASAPQAGRAAPHRRRSNVDVHKPCGTTFELQRVVGAGEPGRRGEPDRRRRSSGLLQLAGSLLETVRHEFQAILRGRE